MYIISVSFFLGGLFCRIRCQDQGLKNVIIVGKAIFLHLLERVIIYLDVINHGMY